MMIMERKLLGPFKRWLESHGKVLLDPKEDYEVARWKGTGCEQMPIIHRKKSIRDYTVSKSAEKYVCEFLKSLD